MKMSCVLVNSFHGYEFAEKAETIREKADDPRMETESWTLDSGAEFRDFADSNFICVCVEYNKESEYYLIIFRHKHINMFVLHLYIHYYSNSFLLISSSKQRHAFSSCFVLFQLYVH